MLACTALRLFFFVLNLPIRLLAVADTLWGTVNIDLLLLHRHLGLTRVLVGVGEGRMRIQGG
jgi:hypothetical protein